MRFKGEYGFLSNMYLCNGIEWEGEVYKTSETIFQMMKCKNDEDKKRFKILNGFEAKKLGRKVELRTDWDEVKVDVMRDVLKAKFKGRLLAKLRNVKVGIVEDNHWGDRYWGVCNGVGENMLGKLLMEIRDV